MAIYSNDEKELYPYIGKSVIAARALLEIRYVSWIVTSMMIRGKVSQSNCILSKSHTRKGPELPGPQPQFEILLDNEVVGSGDQNCCEDYNYSTIHYYLKME